MSINSNSTDLPRRSDDDVVLDAGPPGHLLSPDRVPDGDLGGELGHLGGHLAGLEGELVRGGEAQNLEQGVETTSSLELERQERLSFHGKRGRRQGRS